MKKSMKNFILSALLIFSQVKVYGNSPSLLEEAEKDGQELLEESALCQLWYFSMTDGSSLEGALPQEAIDALSLIVQFIEEFESEHEAFPYREHIEEFLRGEGYDEKIIKNIFVGFHPDNGARVFKVQFTKPFRDTSSRKKKAKRALWGALVGAAGFATGIFLHDQSIDHASGDSRLRGRVLGVSGAALIGALLGYDKVREYKGGRGGDDDYPLVYAEARTSKLLCPVKLSSSSQ